MPALIYCLDVFTYLGPTSFLAGQSIMACIFYVTGDAQSCWP